MKRIYVFISLSLIVSIRLFCQVDSFYLKGWLDEKYNNQVIMLFSFNKDGAIFTVDTAVVENGTFSFSGKEYTDEFSLISIGNYPDKVESCEIILEKGNIRVKDFNRVWGTKLNDLYQSYLDSTTYYNAELNNLYKNQGLDSIFKKTTIRKKRGELESYMIAFETENLSNIVGEKLFSDEAGYWGYNVFQKIIESASEDFKNKNKEYIEAIHEFYQKLIEISEEREKLLNKPYIDFEFETIEGEPRKLSDYVGKSDYLLIDFWASWCGPCIAEVPHLEKVYEKYKDKGLEIIGISLDDTKKAWEKGLEKVNAPWIQLCNFQGSDSKLTEIYWIREIPYSFILDKSGKIIGANMRGEILDKWLEKTIK